jgi:hypothetical protein
VLVSGASRKSAEAAAAVCAAQGLPATVRPIAQRPRSEEWLGRHGGWLLAVLCGLAAAALARVFAESALWAVLGLGAGYALSWGLRPPASQAPLSGLPAHESSLLRLADGVSRRARMLRSRRPALSALAGEAETTALHARAARDDETQAQLLLKLAASLDDALALEGP